jgi:hypothetical protein
MTRLDQITRVMDELERIRQHYGSSNPEVRSGITMGELDWTTELHRLIWETE